MGDKMEKLKTAGEVMACCGMVMDVIEEHFASCSLEQHAKKFEERNSANIDAFTLNVERDKNCKYRGGELIYQYIDDLFFRTTLELYFQNQQNKWIKMKSEGKPISMDWLIEESSIKLKEKRIIKFNIEP
ncbi:hypothetical protein [Megasphaera sp.]|uniref:hypothetical protein n=1 Tax=Megasphaera sp. TaxID=2023260 RepID=UPI00258C2BDF|nr:hypothetical protein [Megasphaera sp.]